ncbi:MAG: NAD(P)H-binding protein [Sphingorhabdus sp.]|uniref:NAD(P)H-binding protein n=1 Tax=Sphingorhabdus sp. TaxID=1902408 RepID=UPI003C821B6B
MTRVVIAGATGLIGKQLVVALAGHEGVECHILVRRKPERVPMGVIVHEAASADWANEVAAIKADVAISCLGTTMRTAGSKAAFRAIDFDLVTGFAKAAKDAGARHMTAVSSVGASAKASNFYLQTKGEAEAAMAQLGFDRVDFLRPGLLTGGERPESRPGESVAIMLAPLTDLLMVGGLCRYRSIPALAVAQAIAHLALAGGHGKHIHENDAIRALAG